MSDPAFVRVQLFWREEPNRALGGDEQVLIDLLVDRTTREIVGSHPAFGSFGSIREGGLTPFVLLPNGKLDFGVEYEDDVDRYRTTTIRAKPMRKGELVSIHHDDAEYVYEVRAVNVLGIGELP